MSTNAQTVKTYLDFSLLQLGAESYLHNLPVDPESPAYRQEVINRWKFGFNDPTHPFIQGKAGAAGANAPVLPAYNRMVESQAAELFSNYEIIDQHANDSTGFSATLFLKKGTTNEYTLSFRSTEFRRWEIAGDGERDNDGANRIGVAGEGFAQAELASMEDYWQHIRAGERWNSTTSTWNPDIDLATGDPGKLAKFQEYLGGGGKINTTGYSLGAHLASVFTLMHDADVNKTYTFNAAGQGIMIDPVTKAEIAGGTTGAAISQMVQEFAKALRTPLAVKPENLTNTTLEQHNVLINLQVAAINEANKAGARDPFASENGETDSALRLNIYKDARFIFADKYLSYKYPTKSLLKTDALDLLGIGLLSLP